jgi:uracil-DNA glycosylase
VTPRKFVTALANVRMPSVFNPYSDVCPHFDLKDAPARRKANLEAQLQASIDLEVDTLWVARDLGYRGGRRTGIALTDEANLHNLKRSFGDKLPFVRATKGPMVAERTATVIWDVVLQLEAPVFTWNVFPLHPHEEANPLTNRCHTRGERQSCGWILIALLDLLRPSRIVAIGNDAADGLEDLGVDCMKVRHPSYGGKPEFVSGIFSSHAHRHRTPEQPIGLLI